MDTARLFQSGRSQAVRLPKAYRFIGTEVVIPTLNHSANIVASLRSPRRTYSAPSSILTSAPRYPSDLELD